MLAGLVPLLAIDPALKRRASIKTSSGRYPLSAAKGSSRRHASRDASAAWDCPSDNPTSLSMTQESQQWAA